MKLNRTVILALIALVLVVVAILISVYLAQTNKQIPEIASVVPTSGATSVDISTNIQVTFIDSFPTDRSSKVTLTITPEVLGDKKWSSDYKSLFFVPNKPLNPGQKYSLSLSYGNKSYGWSFTTKDLQTLTPVEQAILQTAADNRYSDKQEEVIKNYPWYNDLPIEAKNYFVFFDLQKRVFKAKLYPQKSSSTPIETQVTSFQEEIISKLKALNINTEIYTIEWEINPE